LIVIRCRLIQVRQNRRDDCRLLDAGNDLELPAATGTSPEFWYGVQANYDLWQAGRADHRRDGGSRSSRFNLPEQQRSSFTLDYFRSA